MDESVALTVRELIQESGLGLRLLTGDTGIDRPISGIHISDIPDPAPWLVPGFVLLTTGAVFAQDIGPGLRLLDRLVEVDTAALGVGPGVHVDRVPSEMVTHAKALGLPVFETPFEVPLRAITSYVFNSLASNDLHRLRRTVAVQNHLLDLLVTDNQITRLVESVARLLGMPVLLFDGDGSLITAAGRGDVVVSAADLWRAYLSRTPGSGPLGVVEAARARYYFLDVLELGRVQRVVAAAAAAPAVTEYVETSLSFLARLVALDLLRSRNELEVSRRRRARLLDDLLTGGEQADRLQERLAAQGYDADGCRRLIACRAAAPHRCGPEEEREARERLSETIEAVLARLHVPFLCTVRGDTVAALVSLPARDTQAAADLLSELRTGVAEAARADGDVPGTPAFGCSAPADDVDAVPRGFAEARDALAAAESGAGSPGWVLFERMRGRFRLLDGQNAAALTDLVARTVTPLADWDARHNTRLLATLKAYVESSFSPQQTAAALFVHRNTLQRRLKRIEALLLVDFHRADDVLELYLGVRAAELIGDRGRG